MTFAMAASLRSYRGAAMVGVVALLLQLKRWRDLPRHVKWVPGLPFLGSLLQVLRGLKTFTLLDTYVEWQEQLGMTFAYTVPGKVVLCTVDPKNIEHMLKTNFDNYVKGHVFSDPFTDLLGKGIFNVDGELWYHQRKTSSKMFTKKQFETHISKVVAGNTAKVTALMEREKGTFDMFQLMNRFTLDTIGEIGFSKSIGSLEDPSSPFLSAFDRSQQILITRFWTDPFWKILRLLGLGAEPELKVHLRLLDEYARGIVRELQEKVAQGEDNSFVGLFIKETWTSDKTSQAEQETFMRDMVLNFLIAGRDTTAQCLSWTFFELTQHPEVARKIRDEVTQVCADGPVSYQDVGKLRYVQAVLDEGLRLHPSVP